MHNDHLGWILTCPSNLGTGLRAGAMVKVPLFSAREDFKAVCKKMGLQVRKFSNSILYQKFCLILKIGPRNSWSRLGLNRRNLGYFKCWSIRKIWNSTRQYIYRGSLTGLVENKNLFFSKIICSKCMDYCQLNQIIKWEQALENGEDIEEAVANASLPEKY